MSGSLTGARSTKNAWPSSAASSVAAASASRVLPVPPGPVSVTSRTSGPRASSTSAASSSSRPISGDGSAGKLTKHARACGRAIVLARAVAATGWPPRQARTASITSRHEAVRSSSFLASARATMSSSSAGSSGRSSVAAGGGSSRCACMTATSVSRSNGFFPVRHSKSRQPKAYTSACGADRLALDLLRRRVVERPDEEAGPGQPSRAGLLRDPEVGQVDAVGGGVDQHVRGLHVAMDEVARVRRVERSRHLLEDRDRTVELELPLLRSGPGGRRRRRGASRCRRSPRSSPAS